MYNVKGVQKKVLKGGNVTKGSTKRKLKNHVISNLFLAPSSIGVLVFLVIPFFVVIYYSMIDNPIGRNFVGLENFRKLLENEAFLQAAGNTLFFSLVAVPLVVVFSLGLAVLLDMNIPWKSQFRTFFLSPMMVPVASVVLIWQVIFNYHGAMNELLAVFGFSG